MSNEHICALIDKLIYFCAGGYTTSDTLRSLCKDAFTILAGYQAAFATPEEAKNANAEISRYREAEQPKSWVGRSAIETLERMGYTYCGGAEWMPPLGKKPDFDLIAAKDAKIARLTVQIEVLKMDRDVLEESLINAEMNLEHMTARAEKLKAALAKGKAV